MTEQIVDHAIFIVAFASALGSGLMAGVFFAFSVIVMKALRRLPPAQGIAAMQAINVVVLNPWFLVVFSGTAAGCVLLVLSSPILWHSTGGIYRLSGGLLYLVGTILVTRIFNIPRNHALAAVDPTSTNASNLWAKYVRSWTAWNHIRTITALGAAAALTKAICPYE
jgi:uncharacterized membrane protein